MRPVIFMAGFVQSNTASPRLPLFYQVVTTSTSGLQNAIPTKSSVHVCVILPSSELTYAIPRHFWRSFSFSRLVGYGLVPWRVGFTMIHPSLRFNWYFLVVADFGRLVKVGVVFFPTAPAPYKRHFSLETWEFVQSHHHYQRIEWIGKASTKAAKHLCHQWFPISVTNCHDVSRISNHQKASSCKITIRKWQYLNFGHAWCDEATTDSWQ